MNAETLGTIILAVVAAIGLIGAGIAWFYKRGGQERESTLALRQNTTATTELTKRFDAFMDRTLDRQDATDKRLADHDTRIAVNERDIRQLNKQVQA